MCFCRGRLFAVGPQLRLDTSTGAMLAAESIAARLCNTVVNLLHRRLEAVAKTRLN